jgi:hypothetical protein
VPFYSFESHNQILTLARFQEGPKTETSGTDLKVDTLISILVISPEQRDIRECL